MVLGLDLGCATPRPRELDPRIAHLLSPNLAPPHTANAGRGLPA
jgi:hypothetical protein